MLLQAHLSKNLFMISAGKQQVNQEDRTSGLQDFGPVVVGGH